MVWVDGVGGWGHGWGDGGADWFNDSGLYASAEYLMWWTKGSPTPPLVSGSVSRGPGAGSLADPNTLVVLGGSRIDTNTFSGGRFTAGYWFDDDHLFGVEGSFFFIGPRSVHLGIGSDGGFAIFRPFFNANRGVEDAVRVAFPGSRAGAIAVDQSTHLWGYEANAMTSLMDDSTWRLNLFGGFRAVGLDETLQIAQAQSITGFGTLLAADRFRTENRFWGGQVGVQVGASLGAWSFDFKGKLGLGTTHQTVDISGASLFNRGLGVQFYPGGVLAQRTNSGRFSHNVFGVIPEVGLTVGYQVNDYVRVFAGYNFLYWNNVVRPGTQIDRVININQLPPGLVRHVAFGNVPRPQFEFRSQDFWAHGANVGVEFRY
jgi:hypothetical protein